MKKTIGFTVGRDGGVRRLLAPAAALLALALTAPAGASAAPVLHTDVSHYPPSVPVGTYAKYTLAVSNTGDALTSGPTPSVKFSVPAGMEVISVTDEVKDLFKFVSAWNCSVAGDAQSATCAGPGFFGSPLPIEPGKEACEDELQPSLAHCRITVLTKVSSSMAPGTATPTAEACGGGSACGNTADPTDISPFEFRLRDFDGGYAEEDGEPATHAGAHPHSAFTEFVLRTRLNSSGEEIPIEDLKDASVQLPPGLVGNPQAFPTCAESQLIGGGGAQGSCPSDSQIGTVTVWFDGIDAGTGVVQPRSSQVYAVYNMPAPHGTPALFGFNFHNVATHIFAKVRTGEDYGINLAAKNAPSLLAFDGADFDFWGIPADPSHDSLRCPNPSSGFDGCPSNLPPKPFVSLPTSCSGFLETGIEATSWAGSADSANFLFHDNTVPVPNPLGIDGCNAVDFSPSLEARPTTNVADSASGLDVDLHIPQHEECDAGPPVSCENTEAHLRDATVTLPQGLVVNPSSANGLDGCSLGEFGYTSTDPDGTIHSTPDPATCPDASKQGTVAIETPLVDHPLKGAVYLADPHQNPFKSLLALYIVVNDPQTGVVVKLAGEVNADANTGRITAGFERNPQLPFEDFRLHFFGGAGGALRTPATCGNYITTSSMTPWTAPDSGPPATPSDVWAIQTAPGGGTCPTSQAGLPNSPDLDAGSVSPIAGSTTPTVVNLKRGDGTQEFSYVTLKLPPGLTGRLSGLEQCSDAALASAASKSGNEEKSSPSCPSSSRIGTVDVAAGAGPAPYNTQGSAYLTGPYKGAPLGMAIVTPATAGPFDLGTVVVRVALFVDRNSARITAVSDEIPHILQGIPLDVRSAKVTLDRPDFTRNGTSCDPSSFEGSLVSTLNQSASLAERFQLGECSALAFKPKLGIRLIGGTKRGGHPALRATLQMPAGGANIGKAAVALPHSEFLDQGHIGTVCTRVQFAAKECPAASIYGSVTATSPLVDYTLEGNAYLRSSDNELPDLVMALHGPASQPIEVDAVGRIDSIKGGIRTTFEGVPDIPVSSLVLNMAGGKKGLLENSTNICKGKPKATAEFDGQNGKASDFKVLLKNGKCGKQKRKAKKRKAARRNAR